VADDPDIVGTSNFFNSLLAIGGSVARGSDSRRGPREGESVDHLGGRQDWPLPVQHFQRREDAALVGVQHLNLQDDLVAAKGAVATSTFVPPPPVATTPPHLETSA